VSFNNPPTPPPEDWRGLAARAEARQSRHEKAIEQRAVMTQDDEGISEVPRKRGIANRLQSVFLRGQSTARPPDVEVPDGDVWERERQRRSEHEKRLDSSG
jgi:hypothetical protein